MRLKKCVIIFGVIICSFCIYTITFAEVNKKIPFSIGEVAVETLNLRQGPSVQFDKVLQLNKGDKVEILAQIGNWYVVQTEDQYIGAVSKQYIKEAIEVVDEEETIQTTVLTQEEQIVLEKINYERQKVGIPALEIHEEAQNIARLKARDLVKNNYFSHHSPNYGSIHDMLNMEKVVYKSAAENIAGNCSTEEAVVEWMNSEEHKKYVLDKEYTKTGIGVAGGSSYGKIYVQVFIK